MAPLNEDEGGARVRPLLDVDRLDVTMTITITHHDLSPDKFREVMDRLHKFRDELGELGIEGITATFDELTADVTIEAAVPDAG